MSIRKKAEEKKSQPLDERVEIDDKDQAFKGVVPFWSWTDMDDAVVRRIFIVWRLFQALFLSFNMAHPDEYWQAIEPAYNMVYGGVQLPWEWTG